MESEDYAFYQGLVFLMENNVKDLGYELMFSTEVSLKKEGTNNVINNCLCRCSSKTQELILINKDFLMLSALG